MRFSYDQQTSGGYAVTEKATGFLGTVTEAVVGDEGETGWMAADPDLRMVFAGPCNVFGTMMAASLALLEDRASRGR
jgi:hypothetical protein